MTRRRCFVIYLNLGDAPPGEEVSVNLVIDDSGSMSGEKSTSVRAALAGLIESLPETCRLGLLSFGDSARLFSRPTEHRDFLLDQLDLFHGGSGGTALFDALSEGCRAFEEDGRKRYLIVLTDGGECTSKTVLTADDLVQIALERKVRISCVGVGDDVDRDTLERICSSTGGDYSSAAEVEELAERLRGAFAGILEDRRRILLRPEVTSLLGESLGEIPSWWSQISVDEWKGNVVWQDATHVRYPAAGDDSGQAAAFAKIREALAEAVRGEIDRPGRAGIRGFPPDADLVVVGWLHDPVFRALSARVIDLFMEVQKERASTLPGNLFPFLLPLVRQSSAQPADVKAATAAWMVATHSASSRRGTTVLEIEDTNWHRTRNPHGYQGLSEGHLLCQAANLLRAFALDPAGARELAAEVQSTAGPRIFSAGAHSLVYPRPAFGLRQEAIAVVRAAVEKLAAAKSTRAEVAADLGRKTLEAAGLEPDRLRGHLLAPADRADSASQLAEMQLSLQDFWPPRASGNEGRYLRRLPREIEETGACRISRRLGFLIRLLREREREVGETARARVDQMVDELLVGPASQGSAAALRFLGQCHEALAGWRDGIQGDLEAALGGDIDRLLLFTEDERAFRGTGSLTVDEAMERLTHEIENRPSGVAFFSRHALLSLAVGGLAHQAWPWLAGSLERPPWVGPATVAAAAVVSAVRWRHVRQRLVRAIREACSAISRRAWERAKSHALQAIRGILEGMGSWVGDPASPGEVALPAWVLDPRQPKPAGWAKGNGFDEAVATRHQLVNGLGAALRQALAALQETGKTVERTPNPFVWELGAAVEDPTGGSHERRLPLPENGLGAQLEWGQVATAENMARWREIVRRRRFDELDGFLAYHAERLELPGRLVRAASDRLAERLEASASIGTVLAGLADRDRNDLLAAMRIRAYPPLFSEAVGGAAELPPPRWRALVAGTDVAAARDWSADPVATDATGELHLVSTVAARAESIATWSACAEAWQQAEAEKRLELLGVHGDGPWSDPWGTAHAAEQPDRPLPSGAAPSGVDV